MDRAAERNIRFWLFVLVEKPKHILFFFHDKDPGPGSAPRPAYKLIVVQSVDCASFYTARSNWCQSTNEIAYQQEFLGG